MSHIRVTAVVGNPRPASRTLGVARAVTERIASAHDDPEVEVLDLAVLGPALLRPGAEEVEAALERVLGSDLLVVASPTYKATYAGILKVFLDRVPTGGLAGSVAVPVMTGGAPTHSLSVDVHLRPLLLELGAACPTPGLYVVESRFPELDEVVAAWWARAAGWLSARQALAAT